MDLDNPTPPDERPTSAARRRRARRQVIAPLTPDERSSYIDDVASRAAPSFDFFIFSLLSGAVIGLGFLLDSPYILLLGVLAAPIMAPLVGVSLGTVLGSTRYFGRSIGGLLVGSFLVLLVGTMAGFAARIWLPMDLLQVRLHAQFSWAPFVVLGLGAVLTTATLIKERYTAAIPSVAIAYGLYLPLSAAGFGLGSGVDFLWPDGLVLYIIHLAWAIILGAVTLGIMGFRPYSLFGYSIGGVVVLILIILAIGFGGAGAVVGGNIALPTATYTVTPSLTPTNTSSPTPEPPTATFTVTRTPTKTLTPTVTLTPTATPVEALVNVQQEFVGAVVRDEPDGTILTSLFNGSLVIILGDVQGGEGGRRWVRVYDPENDVEGWVLESLLITATPLASPTTAPSATPAPPTSTNTATNVPTSTSTKTRTPTASPSATATSTPTETPLPPTTTLTQ